MKKTNIILSFVICILSYGCTDLSETVYTGVAMNDFFKNEKELVANVNPEKPDVPLNKNDAFQKVQKRRVQEKR